MQSELKLKHRVSTHLRELGKSDVSTVVEVLKWLESNGVKKRDVDRRTVSKRMMNRLVAAQLLVKAARGDVAACREVMDRTEGKVADVVIQGNFEDLVRALESGRQRLLSPIAAPQAAIEGEVITPHLVVDSASPAPEESHPAPDPTESDTSK